MDLDVDLDAHSLARLALRPMRTSSSFVTVERVSGFPNLRALQTRELTAQLSGNCIANFERLCHPANADPWEVDGLKIHCQLADGSALTFEEQKPNTSGSLLGNDRLGTMDVLPRLPGFDRMLRVPTFTAERIIVRRRYRAEKILYLKSYTLCLIPHWEDQITQLAAVAGPNQLLSTLHAVIAQYL